MSCPPGSYCKTWQNPSVCQGTNQLCGPSAPPASNPFCCIPGMACGPNTTGTCPAGSNPVSSCDQCSVPVYKTCCKNGACYQQQVACDYGDIQVNQCSDCPSPTPVGPNFPTLTCCNDTTCNYINDIAACPQGYVSEFCCLENGELTFAAIAPPNAYGEVTAVCPQLGATPYDSYDAASCSASPVTKCCYNGTCYPSKDPQCLRWSNTNGVPHGNPTTNCEYCLPSVNSGNRFYVRKY